MPVSAIIWRSESPAFKTMKLRNFAALVVTACLMHAACAHAQFRTLPAQGKRATVGEAMVMPYVKLGGKSMRLAPGAVIYDQQNRFIVHNALPAGADVLFTTDTNGDVGRIYMLSAREQELLGRKR